jgi:hypothetical protein
VQLKPRCGSHPGGSFRVDLFSQPDLSERLGPTAAATMQIKLVLTDCDVIATITDTQQGIQICAQGFRQVVGDLSALQPRTPLKADHQTLP